MSRFYVTHQLEKVRAAVFSKYKEGSIARECLQSALDSDIDDNAKTVIGCLVMAADWEDAHDILMAYKGVRSSTAKTVQRDALNKWSGAQQFQAFFEGKGYRLLRPEQIWYLPQTEFIPGRTDNANDEYGLAKAVLHIPEEKIPLFDEGYKAYLRGRMRDARVPTMRMSYKDLCCMAALLSPKERGQEIFSALLRKVAVSAQADINRNLMHAHELIRMTCLNMDAPLPDYDLHDFLVVSEVRRNAPKNIVDHRKRGPGLAQINFPKPVEEPDAQKRPQRSFKSVVRAATRPESLVGRDGFDLQAVQPTLAALVRSGDISHNMKKVFNALAAENAPEIKKFADDHDMTPAKVMMSYTNVRNALSNLEFGNVPRLK